MRERKPNDNSGINIFKLNFQGTKIIIINGNKNIRIVFRTYFEGGKNVVFLSLPPGSPYVDVREK
jgi:hypothetical protein